MNKTIVYVGPTISTEEAKAIVPNATFLPPVKSGDLFKALNSNPERIVLIDGLFETTGSVWHKEILAALSQGIEVYGSSSMGALRAAECCCYGMVGIGKIFKNYLSERIVDDDEVALVHTKSRYSSNSTPLINVRYTLIKAVKERAICKQTCKDILHSVKSDPYHSRNIFITAKKFCTQNEFDWILNNYVDQKKLDAIELLTRLSKAYPKPLSPTFKYNETIFSRKRMNQCHVMKHNELHSRIAKCISLFVEQNKIEIPHAIEPDNLIRKAYLLYTNSADNEDITHLPEILRGLSSIHAHFLNKGIKPSLAHIQELSHKFRRSNNLLAASETEKWMKKHKIEGMVEMTKVFSYFATIKASLV